MAYVGSQVSLISTTQLRYVGTISEINSNESTITLMNVLCYGSEGRRNNPAEEVPYSQQIHPSIIFRSTDISTVNVLPAQINPFVQSIDPNVNQYGYGGGWGYNPQSYGGYQQSFNAYGGQVDPNATNWSAPSSTAAATNWGTPQHIGQQSQLAPASTVTSSAQVQQPVQPSIQQKPSAPVGNKKVDDLSNNFKKLDLKEENLPLGSGKAAKTPASTFDPKLDGKAAKQAKETKEVKKPEVKSPKKENKKVQSKEVTESKKPKQERKKTEVSKSPAKNEKSRSKSPTKSEKTILSYSGAVKAHNEDDGSESDEEVVIAHPDDYVVNGTHKNEKYQKNAKPQYSNTRNNSSYTSRGRGGHRGGSNSRTNNRQPHKKIEIPDSDFDFETMNAKFTKEESKENENISLDEEKIDASEEESNFYDKSSFFDDISCDAKDRSGGNVPITHRERISEERKLNFETFGQAGNLSNRNIRGRRGGYRGRGGNRNSKPRQ